MLGSKQVRTVDYAKHMDKHRRMKRKLVEFMSKQVEAQEALDKANRRIRTLEKQNKDLKQQQKSGYSRQMDVDSDNQGSEDEDKVEQPSKRSGIKRKPNTYTIETIPRDEDGKAILPLELGPLTLISLGTIVSDKPAYHCARHIYPLGYTVERNYMSKVDASAYTTYTCTVEEGDDNEPMFVITPKDDPENKISGKTATSCWTVVARGANKIRRKSCRNSISGPEYYGLAHPIIRHLIEEDADVDKCTKYKKTPPKP
ncbi:unnamed protein product [Absidia cylindrospora]